MNNTQYTDPQRLSADEARRLLELFEAGETSAAEEQALYAFFRRADLPADLRPLRPLMAWYEGGCLGEPQSETTPSSGRPNIFRRSPILRAAAAVAVLISIGLMLLRLHSGETVAAADIDPYAGCYVIRHGERITDPEIVRSEVDRARALSDSINTLIAARTDSRHLMATAVARHIPPSSRAYRAALDAISH